MLEALVGVDGDLVDKGAAPLAAGDKTFRFQASHDIPDHSPAAAEARREFRLGGKLIAWSRFSQ